MSELSKPKKPYPDDPLFAHENGQWGKQIRGRLHDFGVWDDADGALAKYLEQRDTLQAGRVPCNDKGGLTIRELANQFLTSKERLLASGDITEITFRDNHRTGKAHRRSPWPQTARH